MGNRRQDDGGLRCRRRTARLGGWVTERVTIAVTEWVAKCVTVEFNQSISLTFRFTEPQLQHIPIALGESKRESIGIDITVGFSFPQQFSESLGVTIWVRFAISFNQSQQQCIGFRVIQPLNYPLAVTFDLPQFKRISVNLTVACRDTFVRE